MNETYSKKKSFKVGEIVLSKKTFEKRIHCLKCKALLAYDTEAFVNHLKQNHFDKNHPDNK